MSPGSLVHDLAMSQPINVSHALGSYPVYVRSGILAHLGELSRGHLPERRLALITDQTVNQLYQAGRLGSPPWQGESLQLPAGEIFKTRESWTQLSDTLMERDFGRDTGLLGLGGGVVGDVTGFVAATYMRGVPYLLAPTTLLAMVDASVGGKTGVNTPQGKNLIGAFHPPSAVLADPLALKPLPEKEYREGLAEAVKHGLIADAAYFHWIESERASILDREPEAVVPLVRRSVEIKAEVVSADERESGRRAILNAGHTVAHALESAFDYRLSHGDAVALGLQVECEVSERLRIAAPGLRKQLQAILEDLGLPLRLPGPVDLGAVLDRMSNDKKNRAGQIHCALIEGIGMVAGRSGWTTPVPRAELEAALRIIV
jgi:3-dehydroquinate synthase